MHSKDLGAAAPGADAAAARDRRGQHGPVWCGQRSADAVASAYSYRPAAQVPALAHCVIFLAIPKGLALHIKAMYSKSPLPKCMLGGSREGGGSMQLTFFFVPQSFVQPLLALHIIHLKILKSEALLEVAHLRCGATRPLSSRKMMYHVCVQMPFP